VSAYKCAFSVMPDLVRHPEGIGNTGFPIKDFGNDRLKNGSLYTDTK